MRCQASISNTVAAEDHSNLTVIVRKLHRMGQNGLISVKQIMRAYIRSEKTEIHSENEGNNGVEPVSGPDK